MNVMVPVSRIESVSKYSEAGADEFYFGFYDENWNRKYGIFEEINRMYSFGTKANFDIKQMNEVIDAVKGNGKKAYLTLNSPVYSYEQHNYIRRIAGQAFWSRLDGVIVGDPAIVNIIKETDRPVVLSTMAGGYNSLIIDFYKKLGVRRMIIPRDVQLRDIWGMVKKFPELEFEVFLMRNGCKYSDSYCMSFHGRKHDSMCSCMDKSLSEFIFSREFSHELCKEIYSNNKLFTEAFHKKACGLCSIKELYKMGIHSVKIVGRADNQEAVCRDIFNVKRIINAMDREETVMDRLYDYSNCLYGLNCYYQ